MTIIRRYIADFPSMSERGKTEFIKNYPNGKPIEIQVKTNKLSGKWLCAQVNDYSTNVRFYSYSVGNSMEDCIKKWLKDNNKE